jgi:hypothetical protein
MLEPEDDPLEDWEDQWAHLHDAAFLADGRVVVFWTELADPWEGTWGPTRSGLYDPETDSWTELTPSWDNIPADQPDWLWGGSVALADGSAITVVNAPEDVSGTTTQSALFDPLQSAWLSPVDVSMRGPISTRNAVVICDGRVLMFGGGKTYLYDPATSSWEAGPELPFDDPVSTAVLDDGSVLALSADGHAARLLAGGATWQRAGRTGVGRGAYVIEIRGGAVALGGHTDCGDFSCFDHRTAVYRADTDRWSHGPDIQDARPDSVTVLLTDGRLLIAGGLGGGGTDCESLAGILSPDTLAWQRIEPMPVELRSGYGQVMADGTVLIIGEAHVIAMNQPTGVLVALSYLP